MKVEDFGKKHLKVYCKDSGGDGDDPTNSQMGRIWIVDLDWMEPDGAWGDDDREEEGGVDEEMEECYVQL